MPKRNTWGAGAAAPVCPNNTRHGLRPDERGGYRCETCTDELAGTRSRLPVRWAFANKPLDEILDERLVSNGEGLPSVE